MHTKFNLPNIASNFPTVAMFEIINRQIMRDFRLPPQCKWDLLSSGMLRSVYLWLAVLRRIILEPLLVGLLVLWKIGPIGCPETSVTNHNQHCVTFQKTEDHRFFFSDWINQCITYFNARLHTCISGWLLVIALEMRAKCRLLVAATLVCILHKNYFNHRIQFWRYFPV